MLILPTHYVRGATRPVTPILDAKANATDIVSATAAMT
jgi:hypothetical protein